MFANRVNFKSETNKLSRIIKNLKNSGREIIDLTESNPTKIGLAYDHRKIIEALSHSKGLYYSPDPCGLESARIAIAKYYSDNDAFIASENLYLTASTSEAYSMLFKLVGNYEDQILIPTPGYPLLSYLARFECLEPVFYPQRYAPGKGWYLDLDALEVRITERTKAIVVVNPNNPTGNYIKGNELKALDQICRRNDLTLIIDEVFSDYAAESFSFTERSVVGQTKALTFVLNGFSKMIALPQVKLGWIAVSGASSQARDAKEKLAMLLDFYLSVSAQVQLAVGSLMTLREHIQGQIKERIALNESQLQEKLSRYTNCQMLKRQGGWYAIIDIEDFKDDEERAVELLSLDRTLIHPGFFYDFHRDGFVVLSLLPKPDQFRKGTTKLLTRFGRISR